MTAKLWMLNLSLLAVAAYAGVEFRQQWKAKKAREAAMLHVRVAPVPPPGFTPQPTPPPLLPSMYAEIPQKDLLDPSRNPEVIIIPPPLPPPPPPKEVPPLPVFHGEMNIDGPTAILSVMANSHSEAVHPGEMIGQFKLLEVNRTQIAFEWDGKVIRKSLDEVAARNSTPVQDPNAAVAPPMAVQGPPAVKSALGPGEMSQWGSKLCLPNDNSPEGTVTDGYRKTLHKLPFGVSCTWDPINGSSGKQ